MQEERNKALSRGQIQPTLAYLTIKNVRIKSYSHMAAFADFWILVNDVFTKAEYETLLDMHSRSQKLEANRTFT